MSDHHFWADLHLGHRLVAGLRGYDTPEDHDEAVLTAWAKTVHKHDIIWILGDLAMGHPETALDQVSKMPGRKRFIWGNHDSGHPMHRNAWKYQRPFLEVFESVDSIASIKVGRSRVMLSHFPYRGDHQAEDRYAEFRPVDVGLPLIHGHVHAEWHINDRMFNVGVDHSPKPVSRGVIDWWVHDVLDARSK